MDFSRIASEYDRRAVVHASAGERLLALADIKDGEDVLDIGCGTGSLTMKIRGKTSGRVVGIDSEIEMIRQAIKRHGDRAIHFECLSAEEMNFREEFDVLYCNSTFQWFQSPEEVLGRCFMALRQDGRIGVQAPGRKIYCPNFIEAVEKAKNDPSTGEVLRHFREPWFFLETEDEYRRLFERAGFRVEYVEIKDTVTEHTPEEVYRIFDSGASAGYLNQRYYDVLIDEDYIRRFEEIVMESFKRQAQDGIINLIFNRVYLIAYKKRDAC
jgi:ubiquinone/menaquinone biosynthesis C-methylase UbiE